MTLLHHEWDELKNKTKNTLSHRSKVIVRSCKAQKKSYSVDEASYQKAHVSFCLIWKRHFWAKVCLRAPKAVLKDLLKGKQFLILSVKLETLV